MWCHPSWASLSAGLAPLTMTTPPDCSAVHMLMMGAMPMVVPWKYTPLQEGERRHRVTSQSQDTSLSSPVLCFCQSPTKTPLLLLTSAALKQWRAQVGCADSAGLNHRVPALGTLIGSSPLDHPHWITPTGSPHWIIPTGSPLLDHPNWITPLDHPNWITPLDHPHLITPLDHSHWITLTGSPPLDHPHWITPTGSSQLDYPYWLIPIGLSPLDHPIGSSPLDHPIRSPPLDHSHWIIPIGSSPLDYPHWIIPIGSPSLDHPIGSPPLDHPHWITPLDRPYWITPLYHPHWITPMGSPPLDHPPLFLLLQQDPPSLPLFLLTEVGSRHKNNAFNSKKGYGNARGSLCATCDDAQPRM